MVRKSAMIYGFWIGLGLEIPMRPSENMELSNEQCLFKRLDKSSAVKNNIWVARCLKQEMGIGRLDIWIPRESSTNITGDLASGQTLQESPN